MALSLNDKPNDNKPGESKPAESKPEPKSEPKPESKNEAKVTESKSDAPYVDINDSKLNNQTNCYGDGPDSGKKTIEAEVAEKRQAKIDSHNDKNSDLLAAAAQSGDADVHNLLGERAIAELNGDEDALKSIDKQLSERTSK